VDQEYSPPNWQYIRKAPKPKEKGQEAIISNMKLEVKISAYLYALTNISNSFQFIPLFNREKHRNCGQLPWTSQSVHQGNDPRSWHSVQDPKALEVHLQGLQSVHAPASVHTKE